MGGLREYLLNVVAAAFLCGILSGLFPEGSGKKLLRLACGVFLTIVVLRPVVGLNPDFLTESMLSLQMDGEGFSAQGDKMGDEALRGLIKQEAEAYILDKAAELNASIQAEVELSQQSPPVPLSVTISGTVSPYARTQLEQMLLADLGIAKENQVWTG